MNTKKKVVLLILDGWGYGQQDHSDAIAAAKPPFFSAMLHKYPNSRLEASGEHVGLPEGQMGNSEVGHMNLGAGRIVYQELTRINRAVKEGELGKNVEFQKALQYAKEKDKAVHFIGLLSDGGVHAHIDHLKALLETAGAESCKHLFVHAFTDGRDSDPKGGVGYVRSLEPTLKKTGAKLASVIGRYYAMDRDKRWERIRKSYDLLVKGMGTHSTNVEESILGSYASGKTDEFLEPLVCVDDSDAPIATIKEQDVVIFFNFRTDRGRELCTVLSQEAIPEQDMKPLDLYFLTMTNYDNIFKNIKVMYDKENLEETLGEVIEESGKNQLRIAETEKYPHVTFFFSGGREKEFKNEKRLLIPSPKVATYDLKPEMSALEITKAVLPELEDGWADFVCLNFANTDMVGHTGVFDAVVKAVDTVDSCAKKVVEAGLEHGYSFVILADHGNSEFMINEDGTPNTAHTCNLVPCIVIDSDVKKVADGKLGDVAPTILKMMGLEIPPAMSGNVLV